MVALIDTAFTVTDELWEEFKNPSDRYLIEFSFTKNKIVLKDRRTTNNLERFTNYLKEEYPAWACMKVFFRYTNLEAGTLKTAQIAAYTKQQLPEDKHPTVEEINLFLNTLGTSANRQKSYDAGLAYVELVLNKIYR